MKFLQDPPPEFVFEIAADGIAMSRGSGAAGVQQIPLPPGVIDPSPVKENILDPTAFSEAVRKLVPPATSRSRRKAALILPDGCVRIAVLDFETLPAKEEERRSLLNFRLKKTVPFDVEEAALSCFPQNGKKVLVVLTPSEIIAHYEAPFRAAGLHPGLVTISSLAMLDLLPTTGSILTAVRSPGGLTLLALMDGVVTMARTLETSEEDVSSDLFQTLAYIEDHGQPRPSKVFLAGFETLPEVDLPVEILPNNPGLAGYLTSLSVPAGKAA